MAQWSASRLLNRQTLIIIMMGFASGLPLALLQGTLQAWMKTENVSLATIGLFAFMQIPHTLKFLWSPFMDRYSLTSLGRRRSWMLVSQVLLILAILALSMTQPKESLLWVVICALAVAFFSASQDIVLDAWRRESLPDEELGWGSSVFVSSYLFAYRLVGGGLAVYMADSLPWSTVYQLMAATLLLGVFATLICREPEVEARPPRSMREAVFEPFVDYFAKPGAVLILLFILLYKMGDNMALQMTTPYFLELGYSLAEVGSISKLVGWLALSFGSLVGGALIIRLRIGPALFWFGILQLIAILSFAILSYIEHSPFALGAVIAFENMAVGMGTSAFVAFMATLTNKKFTATQYALLTSFMGIPRSFAAAPTGYMAESLGWPLFFVTCALIAIPGLLLIRPLQKRGAA